MKRKTQIKRRMGDGEDKNEDDKEDASVKGRKKTLWKMC